MEQYAKLAVIFIPAFFICIFIEKAYGYYIKNDPIRAMDILSSLGSGYVMAVKETLKLTIHVFSYGFLYQHLSIWEIKETWYAYILAFFALDFHYYWGHRIAHEVNLFWNKHIIHHSAEDYNLAISLRESVSNFINVTGLFLLPAAILGVPENIIQLSLPLHLLMQFWYHTKYIGKLGIMEEFMVTPSHHRVHHAMNPEYVDKNYGGVFILWDKWFGTFQEERDCVPAVFGVTRPVRTWNPIKINFQHLWLMISDAIRSNKLSEILLIWFKPTGYRPKEVEAKYPIVKINNVYEFERYYPKLSLRASAWVWIQNMVTLIFTGLFFLLLKEYKVGLNYQIYLAGLFVFLQVYAYTDFMDKNRTATFFESIKSAVGIVILVYFNGWFGLSQYYIIPILTIYFVISPVITFLLNNEEVL